jgi:hypothetical protein
MPSSRFFESMYQELRSIDKIAEDEDYLTEAERKRIKKREEGRDIPGRIASVGAGMTMASGTLPVAAKGALSPAPMLYHGTTLSSANKILNVPVDGQTGILTRFAGKAGRLNEKMLSEAVARSLEDSGVNLTDDEIIRFVLGTKRRLSEASMISNTDPEVLARRYSKARHGVVREAGKRAHYKANQRLLELEKRLPDDIMRLKGSGEWSYLSTNYYVRDVDVGPVKRLNPDELRTLVEYARTIRSAGIGDYSRVAALRSVLPAHLKDEDGYIKDGVEHVARYLGKHPDLDLDALEEAKRLQKKSDLNYWELRAKGSDEDYAARWAQRLKSMDTPPYDSLEIVRDSMRDVLRQKGVKPEEADKILATLEGTLSGSGRRIYFGWTPSSVAAWGEKGSEGVMFARKAARDILKDKDFAKVLDDITEDLSRAAGKPVDPFPAVKFTNVDDLDEALEILMEWINKNQQIVQGVSPEEATKIGKRAVTGFTTAGNRFMVKQGIVAMGDVLTMGIVPETKEIWRIIKHRPQRTRKMTLEQAGKHIQMLEGQGAKKSIVIGARVPAGSLRWLTDFPGLGPLMAVNPGLKHAVARFIPNFDPSRDISIPDDVLTPQFRSIDIVDMDTGKFERIKITDGKLPKNMRVGRYLKGLAVLAPIALIGTLGLDLAQAGVRGDRTVTTKLISGDLQLLPSRKNPKVRRWQRISGYFEKAASRRAASKAALSVAKFTVPPVVIGAAGGIGAELAVEKISPRKKLPQKEPARTAAVAGRSLGMNLPAMAFGLTAGAVLRPKDAVTAVKGIRMLRAASKQGKYVDPPKGFAKALAKLYGAGMLGSIGATSMAASTDSTRRGLPAHLQSPINTPLASKKGREITKKYPQVAAVAPLAAVALAAPTLTYAARKYYPGHSLAAVKLVTDRGGLFDLQEKWLVDAAKWMRRKRYPSSPQMQRDIATNQGMKIMNEYFEKLEKAK